MNGEIAGAGLDVFTHEYESLPPNHPLLQMENIIITPHSAGNGTPPESRVNVFLENLNRYIRRKEMLNAIDNKKMILISATYRLQ